MIYSNTMRDYSFSAIQRDAEISIHNLLSCYMMLFIINSILCLYNFLLGMIYSVYTLKNKDLGSEAEVFYNYILQLSTYTCLIPLTSDIWLTIDSPCSPCMIRWATRLLMSGSTSGHKTFSSILSQNGRGRYAHCCSSTLGMFGYVNFTV